jgi:oxygen-independent coproporphyrinogen-3 oxidase
MNSTQSTLSIYLHIPFCGVKCSYCAFNTYVNLDNLIQPFTKALRREIALVGRTNPGLPVGTIFFGGGTPSLLTPGQIESILQTVYAHFQVQPDAEISLEANPGDLNVAYLRALRGAGINRLSIGMQSAIESELILFDRRHDNDAVVRSVSAARQAGFDNLNLDLIYGVPHQTLDNWETSLAQMTALQPEHVSLYALGLEDGTSMKLWVERGQLPTPDDDLAADMYDMATERLAAAGYEQYEISNWSKPDFNCRHNLQYWYNHPYVGLGPGAHGFAGGVRYAVARSPQKYIQAFEPVDPPREFQFPYTPAVESGEKVDRETEIAETLIMTLRLTKAGVRRADFAERFGTDLLTLHGAALARFQQHGLLEITDEVVRLTSRGRMLSNMIFRELV